MGGVPLSASVSRTYARPRLGWVLTIGLLSLLVLAGCGQPATQQTPLPAGWHDKTPPTDEAYADFAVSFPSGAEASAIAGCATTARGPISASPDGRATLWTSTDGGAHWQSAPQSALYAGCQVAFPAGSTSTFFVENLGGSGVNATSYVALGQLTPNRPPTLTRLFDERAFASDSTTFGAALQNAYTLLQESVYRDGKLYAPAALDRASASGIRPGFSVSRDNGVTWQRLEGPGEPGWETQAIAPDYRSPQSWYRLVAPQTIGRGYTTPPSVPARLEHSRDDGRTWQVVAPVGPVGLYNVDGMAAIRTSSIYPNNVCIALDPEQVPQNSQPAVTTTPMPSLPPAADLAGQLLPEGQPFMPSRKATLLASGDGGASWAGGIIPHNQLQGPFTRPGELALGPSGACHLSTSIDITGASTENAATLWSVAPGTRSTLQPSAQLHGYAVSLFTVVRMPNGTGAALAVAQTVHPLACTSNGQGSDCTYPASAPRVLVAPLP